jgi:putative addiction module component (TIGR02574 family)
MNTEIQINSLSIGEKLELIDELWSSMADELDLRQVSEQETKLLDERWESFLKNPDSALTIEEFQKQMKAIRS